MADFAEGTVVKLGETTAEKSINVFGTTIALDKIEKAWEEKLSVVFPPVSGKKEQLSSEAEEKIIGLHTHQLGFEGIMKTEDKALAEKGGFEIGSPTLEDIMIHIERR